MSGFSHPLTGVRALLAAHDWSDSPLGHPDSWPPELATATGMALNTAFPMVVAWGPDLRLLYNDAYARVIGDKHPQALGLPFRQVWPDNWAELVPIIDRALSNKPAVYEDQPLMVPRNGQHEQAWFTFSYAPLQDSAGLVAGLFCTVIETTARLQAERRARFELRLADALRPLSCAAELLSTASRLLGCELGVARAVYGAVDMAQGSFTAPRQWTAPDMPALSRTDFLLDEFGPAIGLEVGTGMTMVVDDTASDPRCSAYAAAYRVEQIGAMLTVPLMRDGQLRAYLSLHQPGPHRWSEDDVRLTRDTAERTWAALEQAHAEATLRAERDRSRYIFDTMQEGFALVDAHWRLTEMNAEGLRLCRRSAAELIGRPYASVFPEIVDTAAGAMLARAMAGRVAGAVEYQLPHPHDRGNWLEWRAFPTQDGGIALFFRDISERKHAVAKLKAADQRKDEFLAMLAHELRNPLAPISAAAMLLDVGALSEQRVRQSSAIIGRQVRHMKRLIDDLLDVSRVTRGLIELERSAQALQSIVDEAVEQVRPQLQARRQRLTVQLDDSTLLIDGDRARLVQVLANLLGNAVKYTPEERAIAIHAQRSGDWLELSVVDEGIGMEPELTERAFDLFAQAKRTSDRSQGGLGLGLALVRDLVELHGGSVSCASRGLGQGSRFTVRLPLAAGAVRAMPDCVPVVAPPAGGLKLLVVDDNIDAATTLALLLGGGGDEVVVEHDAQRGLAQGRSFQPDVCLLDIGLPDMDGRELARRLRAQAETARSVLIAVSGYGQQQDRLAALAAGFDHHLVKPVDMTQLCALLAPLRPAPGESWARVV